MTPEDAKAAKAAARAEFKFRGIITRFDRDTGQKEVWHWFSNGRGEVRQLMENWIWQAK